MRQRKWGRPLAIEREYKTVLREAAALTRAAVQRHVEPTLTQLHQDAIEDIPPTTGWYETLRQGFISAAASIHLNSVEARVKEFADRVSTFNRKQFRAVVRSVYGIDIFKSEPWLIDVLTQWESENIKLIRSIPRQSLDSLHGKIVNAVRAGTPVADVKQMIHDNYGTTYARSELIARDQIGKLNGQLTQERQTDIGVKEYKWRGSLDERERDEHVEREGERFSWDKPPFDGHPGEPIQCRCTAEPILPLLEDLEGLQYTDLAPARGITKTQLYRKEQGRAL